MLRVPVLSSKHGPGDFLEEVAKIWERYGDRGWADLAQYTFGRDDDVAYFPMRSWLLHQRATWPGTILHWPRADHQGRHCHAQGAGSSPHHP